MSPRATPPRSPAVRPKAYQPKGARLPAPGLVLQILRCIALMCAVLVLAGLYLRPWADAQLESISTAEMSDTDDRTMHAHIRGNSAPAPHLPPFDLPSIEVALPMLVRWFYRPPQFGIVRLIAIGDMALIVFEMAINMWLLTQQKRRMRAMPVTYARVRAPAPAVSTTGRGGGAIGTPSGDQFFRAIQKEGLPFHFWRRYSGRTPWVAFTLTGLPDEPVELGFVVASQRAKQRDDMEMAIRTVIQGQVPGVQVEQHPDPLAAVLHMEDAPRIVGTCDYILRLPPHYPLRFLEDITGSDLLGPFLAALTPHGTLRTEAQRADGTIVPVGPTLRELRQILHLTAGMGTGKSRLLANICKQLIPYGFLLLDGKGDDCAGNLVATMRGHIPLSQEGRVVLLDILDTEWPFGLNPMAGIDLARPGGVDQGLAQLLAVFARLDPETWGKSQGMQQYAKMGALLVLETEHAPTLAHVKQVLIDDGYCERLLPKCSNPDVVTFWRDIYPRTGEQQKQSRDALLRRLDSLLATETTRYMVTQPNPTLNLLDAMEHGLIVLVPMPEMTLGDLAGTIGMIVFQAVVRAAMNRDGDDQSRATYALVIDEFQVFVGTGDTKDVRKALTQLRSLGIAGIYAHQSLTQLGELEEEMMTNAASRIILKTQEPDASTYAQQYAASGLTAADISGQDPNEHQYAVLQCEGRPTNIFSMQTLPWPSIEPIEPEPYVGEPWQAVIPADSCSKAFDRRIAGVIYGQHENWHGVVNTLAALNDDDWMQLLARWDAIRMAQWAHILANPGCIPDRLERQRWLSRLLAATPRILAAVEYARTRRAIEPVSARVSGNIQVVGADGKPVEAKQAEKPVQIASTAIVEGIAPDALLVAPPPMLVERAALDEVRRQRGYRRAKDDLEPGLDDDAIERPIAEDADAGTES